MGWIYQICVISSCIHRLPFQGWLAQSLSQPKGLDSPPRKSSTTRLVSQSPHSDLILSYTDGGLSAAAPQLSMMEACQLVQDGLTEAESKEWSSAIPKLQQGLELLLPSSVALATTCEEIETGMNALSRSYAETNQFELARQWTDELYTSRNIQMAEPAYHLCRRLRETGHTALAYYYYRIAKSFSKQQVLSNPRIPFEPAVYDYLLDYEKSILWSYIGDIHEHYSLLHGLAFSMHLLENPLLPHHLRESVLRNLQYYAPSLKGELDIIRAQISTDEEWRYSTPTFVDTETLIRVVNYYVSDDGSYHVSKGDKVKTRLISGNNEERDFEVRLSEAFTSTAADHKLIHDNVYILGLEDTRAVVDMSRNGTVFTLSASQQYSKNGQIMNQVLGVLNLQARTHTIQNVIAGPYSSRHDKNWVFAGGIDHVVYSWYPAIEIGAVDPEDGVLRIHTTIPSPASFETMRGSTNGALYDGAWWFVTHAVIYRKDQMRKYLHRLVILDMNLTHVVRQSLPFTFEAQSDVEYCLGLKVDVTGLTFGYSVRDRSSRILRVGWMAIGELFDDRDP